MATCFFSRVPPTRLWRAGITGAGHRRMMVDLAKTPSFRLDGKRALVTGGGRGIGLAAASALAQAGAHVTLAARTRDEIEAAAQAIVARGDKADALQLDVTDLDAVGRAIATAQPFDVLVNNAGTNRPAALMDVKVEDFDVIFALNVRAAFFMAQAVARRLIEARRSGSIINVSSQMGHVGAARRTVYCASKHAMEGFTKAMAIELASHNIRVNSLGPTFLETPMTRPFFENKTFREEVLAKIKLGRLGQLEELTGAIVFLASDASSLMTGAALVLDGVERGVRRQDDIVAPDQPGILGRRLDRDHVERGAAEAAGIERRHQRVFVHQGSARGVDEQRARLHLAEDLGVEQAARGRHQWSMDGDEVGDFEQPVKAHALDPGGGERLLRHVRIMGDNAQPERLGLRRQRARNVAEADETEHASGEPVDRDHGRHFPASGLHQLVRQRNFPRQREQQ